MTLQEIQDLKVEDVQELLEFRLIEKDAEVVVSPLLLEAELDLYKAELTATEQARLDEAARLDDLQDRYDSLKDHNAAMASISVSNGLHHFTTKILRNPDKVEAETKMAEIESADTAKFDEYQLVKYKDDRKKEYPSVADQLDMMYKDKKDGTTTWVDSITATKLKYPKS
jgi:hypothetical protein